MKFTVVFAWLLTAAVARGEWTPPEKPDPQAILDEADANAQKGDYETSLAKRVWFHENALKYQPAMSGVRLSFALKSWLELGEKYPPALAKLKEIRDATRKRVTPKDGETPSFQDFNDLASLNKKLGEESATVKAFQLLDAGDAKAAGLAYIVAQPALVRAKEYKLCGKYIDADESLERIVHSYRYIRKFEKQNKASEKIPEFAKKKFINDASTLVALLMINDRKAEAEKVIPEMKKEEGDATFHAMLAAALDDARKGVVPTPWP